MQQQAGSQPTHDGVCHREMSFNVNVIQVEGLVSLIGESAGVRTCVKEKRRSMRSP